MHFISWIMQHMNEYNLWIMSSQRKEILKALVIFIVFFVSSPSFSQTSADIYPEISKIISVDSWKCNEYIPNVDPKCRFRAIYYSQLKSEASPYLIIEILKWESYAEPMRLIASKRIDVRSNEKTLAASEQLSGEQSIGCCGFPDLHWEELRLKYKMWIGEKRFNCEINQLQKKKFDVYCKEVNE